jgi:hypothetical protein
MIGYDSDGPEDEIEVTLNREVDRAERHVRTGEIENPYLNEDPVELVTRIERCSNEIKAILPLIAQSKGMGATIPGGNDMPTPQDDRILCSAKELLKKECETLCDLVGALLNGQQ